MCEKPEITTTHLLMLAGNDIREDRQGFLDQVVQEKLTTKQLAQQMQQHYGYRRQPGAGRPLNIPKNLKAALIHHNTQLDRLVKLNNQSWFCERFDIIDQISDLPAKKLSDQLREYVAAAKEKSEQLAALAAGNAEELEAALKHMDERRQEQALIEAGPDEEDPVEEEKRLAAQARRAEIARYSARHKAKRIGRELRA